MQLRDLTLADPYSKHSKLRKKDNRDHFKTLPCWFHENHPDSCPRSAENCTFAHGEQDLKPKLL